MTTTTAPTATVAHLNRADGSATYSCNGYSVVGGVNGPVEVQRRDELPEEAAIEIIVRPAIGVGTTRERHLESILHSTLRHIILVQNHPRTLIQITLQVLSTPEGDATATKPAQAVSDLPILPALFQTSILALMSAAIPLGKTVTSTLVAVSSSDEIIDSPSAAQLAEAASTHVLAFSSHGELLVNESEGSFSIETWERVYEQAQRLCRGEDKKGAGAMVDGSEMEVDRADCLEDFVRGVMQEKTVKEQAWKEGLR
ncbi:hypothetical protein L228DRAFT_122105 [Xylona heveae TC161]|uniref:Exoribonuclease phosphorolytic domain-containing protein n=1 Tax=Xylona heveae (strain CBS 132557 / TC161) TaxID=1328760 RepID=A0A165HKW5_XYLHT|nr:hypothetical protein L228DRAFT_122105 [Xylona heveae TC161]KZF23668.1 hypothetical protein L228DRAFT_122105 [Xylona heveae TC161]